MAGLLAALACGCGGALGVGTIGASASDPQETVTFTSAGEHGFSVPAGVGMLTVTAVGGKGGSAFANNGFGGYGAVVTGDLTVTGGEALYAEVAGNGQAGTFASGGTPAAGGGGGASDIRTSPASAGVSPDPRLIVAAGGGGGGGGANCAPATGGPGGAAEQNGSPGTGIASACGRSESDEGGGGFAPVGNSGGAAGNAGTDPLLGNGGAGSPGQLGSGGAGGQGGGGSTATPASGGVGGGGAAGLSSTSAGGGGGGGGLYGGGGGGGAAGGGPGDGGGAAGGSNLVPSGGTATTDTTGTPEIAVSFADTTPPAVTLSSVPSPAADATPTLSGLGSIALGDQPTVAVSLYAGTSASGTALQTLTATVDPATGAYSVGVSPAMAGGTYTAQASQADQAGLVGLSAAQTFTIRTGPVAPVSAASSASPPSKVELFGHLGFVSPSGIAGVFVGCFGSNPCTGSLTIKEGGRTIAYRSPETIPADNGGIVHVALIPSARRALAHGRLGVTVTVADVDGRRASTPERLVPFDTAAAIAGISQAFASANASTNIKIFGHTGFVNTGGTTGVFLGCFSTTECAGTMTLTAGGTVVGGRSSIFVSPNDGSIVHVTLSRTGLRLLAEHHRLSVTVTVTEAGNARAVSRVMLVPYFGDIDDYALVTSPARVGASSTTTFDLALTNESSPGFSLGSAKLIAPAGFHVLRAALPPGARGRVTLAGRVVELRGLSVSPDSTLHVKVTAVAPTSCKGAASAWSSAAWEGENFNVQALTLDDSRSTARMTLNAPCGVHFLTEPASAAVGQHITATPYDPKGKPVSIAVVDGAGKVVTSSSALLTVELDKNPGKATLGGTKTVRAVHGVATFDDLTLSKPSNGYTLTASGSKLPESTSSSFDESSTSTTCSQDGGCQTNLTSGASSFEVIANPDPSEPNSGSLSESVNVGTSLQCPGYSQEDPNWWEFEMSSANRSKTIVYTIKQFLLPLQGTLNAILELTQVCFGSTSDFVTSSGALAPAATLPDGTPGFVGTLPNCPSSGPCIVARQGPLDLNNNIGFDIVVTVSVPEGLSGDPWARA